jgi:hypothetical protein
MTGRRQRFRRQAGRSLLWTVVLVVLAEGAVGWYLNTSGWKIRFPEMAGLLGRWKDAKTPDIVSLGTSRNGGALGELAMREFLDEDESTRPIRYLNACITGGDFYVMDRFLTRADEEHLPLPRMLLIEMSPELLVGSKFFLYKFHAIRQFDWQECWQERVEILRGGDIQRALMAQLNPIFAHRRQLRFAASMAMVSLYRHEAVSTVVPLSERRFELANQTPGGAAPIPIVAVSRSKAPAEPAATPGPTPAGTTTETAGHPLTEAMKVSTKEIAAQQRYWLNDYRINPDAVARLNHLLDFCRRHNIAVLFVHPAHGSPWRQMVGPEIRQQFQAFVADLKTQYGCRFVSLEETVPDELFLDPLHCGHLAKSAARDAVEKGIRPFWSSLVASGN